MIEGKKLEKRKILLKGKSQGYKRITNILRHNYKEMNKMTGRIYMRIKGNQRMGEQLKYLELEGKDSSYLTFGKFEKTVFL